MLLKKTRIRSLKFLKGVFTDKIILAVDLNSVNDSKLQKIGFGKNPSIGDTILPAKIGRISRINAEGYNIVHKNQKMETCYRTVEWTWKQWAGRGYTKEVTEFREVPYKRYPRTFVPPEALEITVSTTKSGQKLLVSPEILLRQNEEKIKHSINLFLELFGHCNILKPDLSNISIPKIVRLNWDVLPPGEYPWDVRFNQVKPFINKAKRGNQSIISKRLEIINDYKPDFAAIGKNGFNGYIVFGFKQKSLYVFESVRTNNATYIFDSNWKSITQLTKKEILTQSLQKYRLIHRLKTWGNEISNVLS